MLGFGKDRSVPEEVLLLGGEAREKGLLQADLQEEVAVLQEEAGLIAKVLLLVHGHQCPRGRPAVSDEELPLLEMQIAVLRTHPNRLDRQVRSVFAIPQVKPITKGYFDKQCNFKLIFVERVGFKHNVGLPFKDGAFFKPRGGFEAEKALVASLDEDSFGPWDFANFAL